MRYKHLLAAFLLSQLFACSQTAIVTLDTPVVQRHDLRDYDKDGVVKTREQCPKTLQGAKIDNYGCGTTHLLTEPFNIDIKFMHDSHVIPAYAYQTLQKLSKFLSDNPEIHIVIEGHTSKVGGANHNKKLSQKRAQAVSFMLINAFDIAPQRVEFVGYGFERLKVDGNSEYAHSINRRIIAEVSHTSEVDEMLWTIYSVDL